MAEVIARARAAELGLTALEVRSAGIAAYRGSPASGGAVRVAAAHGLDLSRHASRPLTEREAEEADLILAMSPDHARRATELGGGGRVALLTSYAGGVAGHFPAVSVPDPIGGSDLEYEETFELLSELVHRALERLQAAPAS